MHTSVSLVSTNHSGLRKQILQSVHAREARRTSGMSDIHTCCAFAPRMPGRRCCRVVAVSENEIQPDAHTLYRNIMCVSVRTEPWIWAVVCARIQSAKPFMAWIEVKLLMHCWGIHAYSQLFAVHVRRLRASGTLARMQETPSPTGREATQTATASTADMGAVPSTSQRSHPVQSGQHDRCRHHEHVHDALFSVAGRCALSPVYGIK